MLVSVIQSSIRNYADWLGGLRYHPHQYEWEAQQVFQTNWDFQAADLEKMYDKSLWNSETQRIWGEGVWQPKRTMMLLIKNNPPTAKWMFDDLFNETKDLAGRMSRFVFACDELLADYRANNPATTVNNHYHDDYRMAALYLAFQYPDSYAPYHFERYKSAMLRFKAAYIPQADDPERFFKAARTLYSFLEKDGQALPNLQRLLNPRKHFTQKSLVVVGDYLRFLHERG